MVIVAEASGGRPNELMERGLPIGNMSGVRSRCSRVGSEPGVLPSETRTGEPSLLRAILVVDPSEIVLRSRAPGNCLGTTVRLRAAFRVRAWSGAGAGSDVCLGTAGLPARSGGGGLQQDGYREER